MSFKLKSIEACDYHRNGVSGKGFEVAIIKATDGTRYLAIRAEDSPSAGIECYVLDLDKAAAGNIAFVQNSWRGDEFADEAKRLFLRKPPERHQDGTTYRPGCFAGVKE